MQKIIYTDESGGVHIVYPAEKKDLEKVFGDLTDEQFENHIWTKSVPESAINARYLDDSEIITDRYFREAWEDDGSLTINLNKARTIHMDNLKVIRNEKLNDLDTEYLKMLEKGGDTKHIAEQKQLLRDMPTLYNLDEITNLEELKNFKPDILI